MARYQWATFGDVNAFCGLVLDNIANLVLIVSMLTGLYQFPTTFVLRYMIPGTALGVLVGDLLFTAMAFRLARKTGRSDVTAMPLGLDTPSTLGMVFFVLGPSFLDARQAGMVTDEAARHAWHVGMCAIVFSGVFKLLCATGSDWIRRQVPRAGLLGSLAAIALVLIAFLPLLEIVSQPLVGFVSLAVLLTTLVARIPAPGGLPGTLLALLAGSAVYYAMAWTGMLGHGGEGSAVEAALGFHPPVPTLAWLGVIREAVVYLPIVIPFALATVIGGIDCTESAAAVGDEYPTGQVIAVEGLATILAGCCGGVIQTVPYIGHPAYKAMNGRAAYTLMTALFVGGAGIFGYFTYLYAWLPQAALMPILIFVGMEITAQSYHATPRRHFVALALATLPALAYLITIFTDQLVPMTGKSLDELGAPLGQQLQTLRTLSGGFILTSLLWASALAAMIDRRLVRGAVYWGLTAGFSLFGIIHSPAAGSAMVLPWMLPALPEVAQGQTPLYLGGAYLLMAGVCLLWQAMIRPTPVAADAEGTHLELG
jgi:AGZA family xanthine/uracil permease-like MFS transporter